MADYCIEVKQAMVKVSRIEDGQCNTMLFNGEQFQDETVFWSRFKEKIEYEPSDRLAFIIAADLSGFIVDQGITLADRFEASDEALHEIVEMMRERHSKTELFPNIQLPESTHISVVEHKQEEASAKEDIPLEEETTDSLQSFYKKQTRSYKRSK